MHTETDLLTKLQRNAARATWILVGGSMLLTAYYVFNSQPDPFLSVVMAVVIPVAAFLSAIIPAYAFDAFKAKAYGTLVFLVAAGILCTGTDLVTNFGSVNWQRTGSNQAATVQNAKYSDVRVQVATAQEELKTVKDMRDTLVANNPWAPTVTAEALQAQVAGVEEDVRIERNNGGCGPKCRALKAKLGDLNERIGSIVTLNKLQKRIDAAERAVATATEKAAGVQMANSGAEAGSMIFAHLASWSLEPGEGHKFVADKSIGLILALFLTFGGMIANFISRHGMPSLFNARETPSTPTAHQTPVNLTELPDGSTIKRSGETWSEQIKRAKGKAAEAYVKTGEAIGTGPMWSGHRVQTQ